MLSNNEQMYISEHYVKWKPGKFRYWESIPREDINNPSSLEWAKTSESKPAIVMIHGYGASLEHWRRTFAGLKGRYRLYALDLLGFGMSEKVHGNGFTYTAELWARQVRDFLNYKQEEKAILVGHSLGGMVAVQFALSYPDKVAGLALVDAAGLPDQGQAEREGANKGNEGRVDFGSLTYGAIQLPFLGEAAAFLLTNGKWAARQSLKQAYWNPDKVTDQLVEQFVAPLRTPGAPLALLAVTRSFAKFQLPLKPGDIQAPTLILWGEHDRSMPPKVMLPRWEKLIPQAETFIVTDAAHCPQDERPDILNPRLMQFIEKVVAEQAAPVVS